MEVMDINIVGSTEEIPKTENQRRRLKLKRSNSICKAPADVWNYWDVSPHEVKVVTASKSSSSNTQSKNNTSTYNNVKLKKIKKKKLNDSSTPRDPMLIESPTMEPGQDPNNDTEINENENENENENDRENEKMDLNEIIIDETHKIEDENIQNIQLNTTNQDNDNDNHNQNDSLHLNDNDTWNGNVEIQIQEQNDNKEQNIQVTELNNNKNNENIIELKQDLIQKNTSTTIVNWKKISVYVGTTVSIIGGAYVCYQTIGHGYLQNHILSKWFKRNK